MNKQNAPASDQASDARIIYADIFDLPHWQSPTRPHMSLHDRAAQFAAYKALSGYEDMIGEATTEINREDEPEEFIEAP